MRRPLPSAPHPTARVLLCALAAAALAFPTPAHAQQAPTFETTVARHLLHVTALDRSGRPVVDLTEAEFELHDGDGNLVPIRAFLAPEQSSLDLALLIDRSLSVSAKPEVAAERIENFLQALSPDDCVYLVPFREQVGPTLWAHPDDPRIGDWLASLPYGGNTALFDAILHAQARLLAPDLAAPGGEPGAKLFPFDFLFREMATPRALVSRSEGCSSAGSRDRSRRLIGVVTDGRDTASEATLIDVLLGAALANIPVLTVGFVPVTNADLFDLGRRAQLERAPEFARRNRWRRSATVRELEAMMKQIALVSGGHLALAVPEDAYAALLRQIQGTYVLGHDGADPADLVVESSRPGVRIAGQPGYFEPTLEGEAAAVADTIEGTAELASGSPEAALALFDRALRDTSDLAAAVAGRATALEQLGRTTEAAQMRRRVEAIAPWLLGTTPPPGPSPRTYVALEQPRADSLDGRLVARSVLPTVGRLLAQADGYGLTIDFGRARFSLQLSVERSGSAGGNVEVTLRLYAPDGAVVAAETARWAANTSDMQRETPLRDAIERLLRAAG